MFKMAEKIEKKEDTEDKEEVEEEKEKGQIDSEISEEMRRAYIDYAMSVIVSRALPAVEDGLKPVQRRILYSMDAMGLQKGQTKKSARIVGDCMGKFHPHGDMAIYDALVRMAQDFSLRYPLVHGQGNFGCFTADTKVALADGRSLSFTELVKEHQNGKRNFTFTVDNNAIKIAEIKNPRRTKENAEVMKVILDNGEEIKCTLNHKFMLRDGSYKEAENLDSGDSLIPLYSRLSTKDDDPNAIGYLMILQPKSNSWDFVHILSDNWNIENEIYTKSTGRIRHHIDFNKLNNSPVNIRRMNWKEHWKIHYDLISEKHKNDSKYRDKLKEGREKFWADEKNREKYSEKLSKRNLENWKKEDYKQKMTITLSEVNKKYLKEHPEVVEEIRKRASITMKRMWQIPEYKHIFHATIAKSNKRRETNLTGKKKFLRICNHLKENNLELNRDNFEKVRKDIFGTKSFTSWDLGIKKYYENDKNLLLCEINGNHKVVRIVFLKEFVDVYDLTIEETHNFALASGIFVHNSMDGDSPAAMRYTEAKLAAISTELLEDIEKETVKFVPNFDNSVEEPETLPGKLPNLLINGASGIAVGMATNLPPHNLSEVCDAINSYINNPDITIEKLSEIIIGPDFPTGGQANGNFLEIYKIGKGRIVLRGKTTTEEHKGKTNIIITEIPYMLNKAELVKDIARLIQEKKLPDIWDLRDESAKGKVRIVIELRKGADYKFTLNRLFKFTRLQDNFDVNMIALVKGHPRQLNLKNLVEEYVKYREVIVTKRTKFDLKKAQEREEIIQGLLIALKDIDAVVKLIKGSKNTTEAYESLVKKFSLTGKQAQAILDMRLASLTNLEQDKLKDEEKKLKEIIKELLKILSSGKEILSVIKKEVSEIKRKYGDERKTQILQRISEIEEKDLVSKKDVVITITDKGYCKRIDVKDYKEQKRGGKGVIGSDLATGDFVKQIITCSTHDYLLMFTNKGRVYWLKAYYIPAVEKYSKGKALINLVSLKDELIQSVMAVKEFKDFLMIVTKKGQVKKMSLSLLAKPRASGVRVINLPLDNSDVVIDVKPIKEKQEVLLVTKDGQAIRFNSDEVRAMGRASYGVTGIKLEKGDDVVSLEVLDDPKSTILTITEKGYGKRSAIEDYRLTGRAGKGVINLKVSDKTGKVVTTVSVNDKDSGIVTTSKGMVIRISCKDLRVMGRATQGVRIIKLRAEDKVTDLAKVVDISENGNEIINPIQ